MQHLFTRLFQAEYCKVDMEATDAKIQTSWEHLEWKVYQSYGNPVGLPIDTRELNWDKGELGKGNTLVQQNLKNGTKEGIETSRKLLNINYLELMKHVDHHWSYMILCTLQKGTTHGDWHEIWRWEGLGKKPDDALDDATFSWERDGWAQWRWTALKRVLHRVTSFGVFLPVSCVVTCQWYADNYARCALWTWCMNVLEATIWVVARKSPAERHVLRSGSPTWPDCIAETLAESLVFQCLRTLYMLRFAVFCYANRCFLHFLRFPTL